MSRERRKHGTAFKAKVALLSGAAMVAHLAPRINQGDIFAFQLGGHNRWTTTQILISWPYVPGYLHVFRMKFLKFAQFGGPLAAAPGPREGEWLYFFPYRRDSPMNPLARPAWTGGSLRCQLGAHEYWIRRSGRWFRGALTLWGNFLAVNTLEKMRFSRDLL